MTDGDGNSRGGSCQPPGAPQESSAPSRAEARRHWRDATGETLPGPPHLVLYDGECELCQSVVRFILRRDSRTRFAFAALEGPFARAFLSDHDCQAHGVETSELETRTRESARAAAPGPVAGAPEAEVPVGGDPETSRSSRTTGVALPNGSGVSGRYSSSWGSWDSRGDWRGPSASCLRASSIDSTTSSPGTAAVSEGRASTAGRCRPPSGGASSTIPARSARHRNEVGERSEPQGGTREGGHAPRGRDRGASLVER